MPPEDQRPVTDNPNDENTHDSGNRDRRHTQEPAQCRWQRDVLGFDLAQPNIHSGSLRPNHQIDIAVEDLQQRQHLVDRLAIVRLIEQAIQLCR
jgi:hypothetical protein